MHSYVSLNLDIIIISYIDPKQGCQIFHGAKYQNGKKYTELPQTIPNVHKIYQKTVKRTKCP
jgi:hypothetical protein